jgi:putative FmdB family regulatory protein
MPIYEYRCEHGHLFEVMQRMTDEPVAACTTCEAPVQRVFHPVAVHFKGKGFYNTDYGTRRRNRELEKSGADGAGKAEPKGKEASSSDAKPSEPAKKADAKPAATSSD